MAQSSHIQAHDYDEASGVLTVQFLNGAVYQYAGITLSEYYNFAQSPSPGQYFWDHIREKRPTVQIAGPDRGGRW